MIRWSVFFFVLIAGCATNPVPPPQPPPGAPTCASACERLEELNCIAAKPTPAGATCRDVCANIEDSGVIEYGVACVTSAPSCSAANDCGGPTH